MLCKKHITKSRQTKYIINLQKIKSKKFEFRTLKPIFYYTSFGVVGIIMFYVFHHLGHTLPTFSSMICIIILMLHKDVVI